MVTISICRTRMQRKQSPRVLIVILLVLVVILLYILRPKQQINRLEETTSINVQEWIYYPTVSCRGHLTAYGNEFVHLKNARFNTVKKTFAIPCEETIPAYKFLYGKEGTPLIDWYGNLTVFPYDKLKGVKTHNIPTFVIMRIEAHNLYHTLCEWFNVFIVSNLLGFSPSNVDIVFLDDRPPGLMDETWKTLFRNVRKHNEVQPEIVFRDLIWNPIGYESPLNFHALNQVQFMNDFYMFFLRSFGVESPMPLDCSQMTVTVIWRKDYMTHPERKNLTGGLIHRKFHNEDEIKQEIEQIFRETPTSKHTIRYVVLENMSMKDQIDVFTNTDILVGMHGAGMSHVMFLPPHAGVFELFPNYWGFLKHFKAFARWRNIKYVGWQNRDPDNEFPDFYTKIPRVVIKRNVEDLKNRICPSH